MFTGISIIVVSVATATVATIIGRIFQRSTDDDEVRTKELVAEAMAHYPKSFPFMAISFYLERIQGDLNLLKQHGKDVECPDTYKQILRDKRLLLQARARMNCVVVSPNCDYNLAVNQQ